ncbi:hypothetical protein G7009_12500 [Pseudomonas capeferrum]|nr:NAD(P)H-dependent oxidoreductase [Pseudomonas capeferrum]MBA1202569.1 hypothetical protein [Pseudomonas capeferrum]
MQISDLYAMGWHPMLSADDFTSRADADHFDASKEQAYAQCGGTVCNDVELEQAKVAEANLVIFQSVHSTGSWCFGPRRTI